MQLYFKITILKIERILYYGELIFHERAFRQVHEPELIVHPRLFMFQGEIKVMQTFLNWVYIGFGWRLTI